MTLQRALGLSMAGLLVTASFSIQAHAHALVEIDPNATQSSADAHFAETVVREALNKQAVGGLRRITLIPPETQQDARMPKSGSRLVLEPRECGERAVLHLNVLAGAATNTKIADLQRKLIKNSLNTFMSDVIQGFRQAHRQMQSITTAAISSCEAISIPKAKKSLSSDIYTVGKLGTLTLVEENVPNQYLSLECQSAGSRERLNKTKAARFAAKVAEMELLLEDDENLSESFFEENCKSETNIQDSEECKLIVAKIIDTALSIHEIIESNDGTSLEAIEVALKKARGDSFRKINGEIIAGAIAKKNGFRPIEFSKAPEPKKTPESAQLLSRFTTLCTHNPCQCRKSPALFKVKSLGRLTEEQISKILEAETQSSCPGPGSIAKHIVPPPEPIQTTTYSNASFPGENASPAGESGTQGRISAPGEAPTQWRDPSIQGQNPSSPHLYEKGENGYPVVKGTPTP